MDVDAYLSRIGMTGPIACDAETLERLQRAHLTAVPFENLDVFHRRGVSTSPDRSVPKIVERNRGGWCFELNGAFAELLVALGFAVTRLAAQVLLEGAEPKKPDHLTIGVDLDRPYLVDVGFGHSFIKPLPLDSEGPHDGGIGEFAFEFDERETTLLRIHGDGTVVPQFRFGETSAAAADFDVSSEYLQTEPGLHWTESPFATRLLNGGPDRVTLLADRLRFRRDGTWSEEPVRPEVWNATLESWFGMGP